MPIFEDKGLSKRQLPELKELPYEERLKELNGPTINIDYSSHVKYIGVFIDSHLSMNNEIKH